MGVDEKVISNLKIDRQKFYILFNFSVIQFFVYLQCAMYVRNQASTVEFV